PLDRTGVALLDTQSVLVGIAKPVLGFDMALFRRRFIQFGRKLGTSLDPLRTLAHDTCKVEHRFDIAFVGGFSVPSSGFGLVYLGIAALLIGLRDCDLGVL